MPVTIATGAEQVPFTVNAMLQRPTIIPELMRNLVNDQFIADRVLRSAGKATGGAIEYWVSGPVYPDVTGGDAEVVAPMAEIPVVNPIIGTPASTQVQKRGLGLRISREIQDRNSVDIVMRGLVQIRNALVRSVDSAMIRALNAAITQTVAVGAPWGNATGTTIRKDIAVARLILANLVTQGYDYQPDTLLMSTTTYNNLLLSPEFLASFIGSAALQSPSLTGNLSGDASGANPTNGVFKGRVWGYDIIASPLVTSTTLLQKNVVGGIADERGSPGQPIEIGDFFPEPAHESMRRNITRAAAGFIDNPLAAVTLVGTG